MKMCEQILKKTAPQYNSNSLNCKNQEKANNSPSYRCAAINNSSIIDRIFEDYWYKQSARILVLP